MFASALHGRVLAVNLLVFWAVPCWGENAMRAPQQAQELIGEALNQGLYGLCRERRQLLERALELAPDYAPARWHMGYVKIHGRWVHMDQPSETPSEQRRRLAYEQRRAEAPDTVDGQMTLADWCRQRRMFAQERSHLNRVIQLEPNHAQARMRLGFRRVGGAWLRVDDFWNGIRETQDVMQAIKEWTPRLSRLVQGFRHQDSAQREFAAEQLQELACPDAIPAIEIWLAATSETAAVASVDAIGELPQRSAALALARLAVMSPWPSVREQSALQLRDRPRDHYVPVMLAALSTPVESQVQTGMVNGRILYRHAFVRETQNAKKISVLDTALDRRPSLVMTNLPGGFVDEQSAADAIASARAVTITRALADINRTAAVREQLRLQQNAIILAINQRICNALCRATHQNLPPSPELWWRWWDEQNDVTFNGVKTAEIDYRQAYCVYEDTLDPVSDGSARGASTGAARRRCECFVAGTPVWTIAGPKPIESIQVGDMVLSQHAETGELVFQPVLQTTIRDPERLIRVALCTEDREVLEASGGHPLWVAGRGWTLFRELESGMMLHTVEGTVRVSDVQQGSFQRTYNLVVADFQTYVVGKHKLLCHDNTDRQPSDAIVPGLLQQ